MLEIEKTVDYKGEGLRVCFLFNCLVIYSLHRSVTIVSPTPSSFLSIRTPPHAPLTSSFLHPPQAEWGRIRAERILRDSTFKSRNRMENLIGESTQTPLSIHIKSTNKGEEF
ncbi:hypothetical protein OCU04_012259 [Sclerotinia nivalis]|uniref:Uncharacterized protein n=1 Tax=Sclerotinia nivalis TaxID=352851 RepID=A0A9X0DE86_9HELO|nr:hypothetical protein OCU04_012259 [Sclerotinia nivalis]